MVHSKLTLGGHLTEGQESMRHARNNLHLHINSSIKQFTGELNILIQTRVQVRSHDDGLGEVLEDVVTSKKRRQEYIIQRLSHPQLIINSSGTSLEIVRILIRIETSQKNSKHQQRINQREKSAIGF